MKKHLFYSNIILLICIALLGPTAGATLDGFTVEEVTEAERARYLSYLDITRLKKEPAKQPFSTFVVNENGYFAVSFRASPAQFDTNYVLVYDSRGDFAYGFSFQGRIGFVKVLWDHDNIFICNVGASSVLISPSGEIVDVVRVLQDTENHINFSAQKRMQKKAEIDGVTIAPRAGSGLLEFLTRSYSQVVVTDSSGNSMVVYDASTDLLITVLFNYAIGWGAIIAIIWISVKMAKKYAKEKEASRQEEDRSADSSGDASG